MLQRKLSSDYQFMNQNLDQNYSHAYLNNNVSFHNNQENDNGRGNYQPHQVGFGEYQGDDSFVMNPVNIAPHMRNSRNQTAQHPQLQSSLTTGNQRLSNNTFRSQASNQ